MARQMEWVPWDLGTPSIDLIIGVNSTLQIAALDPDTLAVTDVQGAIETHGRYFVHRIVGQFFLNFGEADVPGTTVMIVPGRIEVQGADTVLTMYGASGQGATVAGTALTADIMNDEFWYIRRFQTQNTPQGEVGGNAIEHPWWTTVDIKPKRVMEHYESPVITVTNESVAQAIDFAFFMRMLVTPL